MASNMDRIVPNNTTLQCFIEFFSSTSYCLYISIAINGTLYKVILRILGMINCQSAPSQASFLKVYTYKRNYGNNRNNTKKGERNTNPLTGNKHH